MLATTISVAVKSYEIWCNRPLTCGDTVYERQSHPLHIVISQLPRKQAPWLPHTQKPPPSIAPALRAIPSTTMPPFDTPDLLHHLRSQLAERLDRRPMDTWSCSLIRAVLVTMDLIPEDTPVSPEPGRKRRLRLIR